MIVGLVSTYREGALALGAVRSLLPACDAVLVAEGPVGAAPSTDGAEFVRPKDWRNVFVRTGIWASDADKRTSLLERTRGYPPPVWAVIIDADELLLWAEYLPDMVAYAEARDGNQAMGFGLRVVEQDGSCAIATGRVLRADYVERYLISSFHMLLRNGVEVSRPHLPLLLAGEPDTAQVVSGTSTQRRRPLMGEPHIHHRSLARDPNRQVPRLHKAEAEDMAALGFGGNVATEKDGVPIWLPR